MYQPSQLICPHRKIVLLFFMKSLTCRSPYKHALLFTLRLAACINILVLMAPRLKCDKDSVLFSALDRQTLNATKLMSPQTKP